MNRRQYKKKPIHEFYTPRTSLLQPISSIASKFSYGNIQENFNLNYFSKFMSRPNIKLKEEITKEKYRIIRGKLHIYSNQINSYLPVKRNNCVGMAKHSERIKNDHGAKSSSCSKVPSEFWITEIESFNPKLCPRENEWQKKSSIVLPVQRNKILKNFSIGNQKELNYQVCYQKEVPQGLINY